MQSKEKANFVYVLDFSLTFPMFKTIYFDSIIMNCLRKLGALRHNGEVFLLRSSKNLSNVMNVDYFLLLRLVKMKFTHGYRAAQPATTHSFYFKYFAKIAICARHPKQRICFTKNLFRFLTTKKRLATFFQNPIVILTEEQSDIIIIRKNY